MDQSGFEILAPAGDEAMLRAAVYSGADCVYLGVEGFNARRTAANFAGEGLAAAVAFCHARSCKVYAAINTLALPGEEEKLAGAVRQAAQAGVDAVIVQDLATAALVQKIAPGLPLHASTQMSVHSLAGVRALAAMGFSRAILARELSETELAEIAAQSPIELEVFVHGALCVSISGQCYMSATLGGRSANRGACAGPCRLPFCAACGDGPAKNGNGERHHLSLKDLSILDALPHLRAMGIVSAKIEGRLRGPEYCAVVVDSARKALAGEVYDRALLRDVFSRSGFTDGWYQGRLDGDMFGTRTAVDTAASKAAFSAARQLYRRERPRVPVKMRLLLNSDGGTLEITDGQGKLQREIPGPLLPSQQDQTESLCAALRKTGGTPFYVEEPEVKAGGVYLPTAQVNALRREMLTELLQLREQPRPHQITEIDIASRSAVGHHGKPGGDSMPRLRARFERLEQMPPDAPALCGELVLPLEAAEQVPESLRGKTWLWLPRVLFGRREQEAAQAIEKAASMGFLGFEAENIAHLELCSGLPISGGFGLNATNPLAAKKWMELGCRALTLSPELTLRQMRRLADGVDAKGESLAALAYGHLPLMLTRACPLRNVAGSCGDCPGWGTLTDRTGARMPVQCRDGVRSVLNPIPLWMGDKLAEMPVGYATLYFTTESREQAAGVLRMFAEGKPAPGAFTRGLYYKGIE